jgi:hypothetical protein
MKVQESIEHAVIYMISFTENLDKPKSKFCSLSLSLLSFLSFPLSLSLFFPTRLPVPSLFFSWRHTHRTSLSSSPLSLAKKISLPHLLDTNPHRFRFPSRARQPSPSLSYAGYNNSTLSSSGAPSTHRRLSHPWRSANTKPNKAEHSTARSSWLLTRPTLPYAALCLFW